jgi:hypothetical protein
MAALLGNAIGSRGAPKQSDHPSMRLSSTSSS